MSLSHTSFSLLVPHPRPRPRPRPSQRNPSGSQLSQPQTQHTQQHHAAMGREYRPGDGVHWFIYWGTSAGQEHLRRKHPSEDLVFGNSLLHFCADLNRPIFPRIGPQWRLRSLVWRGVYFRTFLSSAQSMRSSLLNRGVKQFNHCKYIYAIPNGEASTGLQPRCAWRMD